MHVWVYTGTGVAHKSRRTEPNVTDLILFSYLVPRCFGYALAPIHPVKSPTLLISLCALFVSYQTD